VNLSDFVLRYRLGEGEWQIFTLSSKETLIGRGEDNDLILDHREVSRHHLRLSFIDNLFQITDLESSNGTQLDGISLSPQIPAPLRPGQMIQAGDFTLSFWDRHLADLPDGAR
jgi:pSer/pThr/pTyr-binding forkhead associated (FHA) protein